MPAPADPLQLGEVAGALLALLLVAYLVAIFVRRRFIGGGQPMFLSAVRRRHQQAWRMAYGRFTDDGVLLFLMGGLSVRPFVVLPRDDNGVELSAPERRPMLNLLHDPVFVTLPVDGERVEVALARDSYTALRSWWESAPPRRPRHRT